MKRMGTAIVAMAVLGLVFAAQALAADKCGNPAICQYVEHVPTSKGSKPATRENPQTVAKLPTSVIQTIRKETTASEAETLEQIATTAGYGAPAKIKVKKSLRMQLKQELRSSRIDSSKPIPAAFGAVSGGGSDRLLALVIVMGMMLAVAVAIAGLRRRNSRR
jgi:hypothetical protein